MYRTIRNDSGDIRNRYHTQISNNFYLDDLIQIAIVLLNGLNEQIAYKN
jgi:hypothetical protein